VSISSWGTPKIERIETMKVQLIKFTLQMVHLAPKRCEIYISFAQLALLYSYLYISF